MGHGAQLSGGRPRRRSRWLSIWSPGNVDHHEFNATRVDHNHCSLDHLERVDHNDGSLDHLERFDHDDDGCVQYDDGCFVEHHRGPNNDDCSRNDDDGG